MTTGADSGELALRGGPPVRDRPWPIWPEWGEPEQHAIERVLMSGNWGGFPSPNHEAQAFNVAFAELLGCAAAVACANGTFSLTLALQAAGVSPGAEVVTTAYSFVGTAGGILQAGAVPVFVDVEPESLCIDPTAVEHAITPRTEAVMPVHLASQMADMDRLGELCRARGLLLVEDCAHAHGARWRDRAAGTIGDLGSFSMQSSKLLTAGEGGAVTTNDTRYAERLRAAVNCGRLEPGATTAPLFGHNLRITEWQAAVLRAQLERLPDQNARRRENVERLREALREIAGVRVLDTDPRITAPTHYQVIVRYARAEFGDVPRDRVVAALEAEGVPASGRFYVPICDDPLFARDPKTNPGARTGRDYWKESFPVAASAAYDEAIWLPHELFLGSADDVADIARAFAKLRENAHLL